MADATRSGTVRRGLTFWRRSIQARVVVSTLLLSAVVISGVGWLLIQQTQEGLLENRVDAVVAEAANETADASSRLAQVPGIDTDESTQLEDLFDPIKDRGAARGFQVVLAGPAGSGVPLTTGGSRSSPGLDVTSVPVSLEERFAGPNDPAWTYTRIRVVDAEGLAKVGPGLSLIHI